LLVSCSEYEGFPNVILEAMAARLPVLATPAGDAARIIKDQTTGYLLKADDPQGMADCIVRLLRAPELSARMGEAARKEVEEDYNLKSLAPRLLSVFSDFAQKRGKASIVKMLEQKQKPIETRYSVSPMPSKRLPASAT
jgi:glycosyltransferase involved in cell wall biosynthesis